MNKAWTQKTDENGTMLRYGIRDFMQNFWKFLVELMESSQRSTRRPRGRSMVQAGPSSKEVAQVLSGPLVQGLHLLSLHPEDQTLQIHLGRHSAKLKSQTGNDKEIKESLDVGLESTEPSGTQWKLGALKISQAAF